MSFKQQFACQDDTGELLFIDPWLLIILADSIMWGTEHKLPIVVTSLVRGKDDGISESLTHQEGRAIDLSVKGWKLEQIEALAKYLNDKYAGKIGTSPEGKPPLVCKYHNNGNGWHFHLQVRRYLKFQFPSVMPY